ncbi:MAG: hypothetical protein WCI36_00515 [bacterium]
MFNTADKKYLVYDASMWLVGLFGVAFAIYLGFSAHNASKKSLITRANTISQFITAKDIESLAGSSDDLNNKVYNDLKSKLIAINLVNQDIRFVYINGMRNGKVFFYVDSENADSAAYSPPGQQYDEASDMMKNLFQSNSTGFEVAGDRWGMWASALVPIDDHESGKVVALLGVDITARKYITDIFVYSFSSLLLAALIVMLLSAQKSAILHMHSAEESLKANNLEILSLKKIIEKNGNIFDK